MHWYSTLMGLDETSGNEKGFTVGKAANKPSSWLFKIVETVTKKEKENQLPV